MEEKNEKSSDVVHTKRKSKMTLILALGLLLVGAIVGLRWYLDSQIPKGDPQYDKNMATAEEAPAPTGGRAVAPGI